jgi:hypothetical protein
MMGRIASKAFSAGSLSSFVTRLICVGNLGSFSTENCFCFVKRGEKDRGGGGGGRETHVCFSRSSSWYKLKNAFRAWLPKCLRGTHTHTQRRRCDKVGERQTQKKRYIL